MNWTIVDHVGWIPRLLQDHDVPVFTSPRESAQVAIPAAQGVAMGAPLDIPGSPVPVLAPGHTSGHTCYLLAHGAALVSRDALITGHWLSRRRGPQPVLGFFDHDHATALDSIRALGELDADIVLPGHGELFRGSAHEAARLALE